MCCTRLAGNTGRKNDAKNRHLRTITQLCRAISSQSEKELVNQQYLLHMYPQYGELRPTSGWDRLTSLGYPCKFQLVSRLGSVTARHLVVGVSQTLRRWTEGATYIRQGDHHVGHWPTFLVKIKIGLTFLVPAYPCATACTRKFNFEVHANTVIISYTKWTWEKLPH